MVKRVLGMPFGKVEEGGYVDYAALGGKMRLPWVLESWNPLADYIFLLTMA